MSDVERAIEILLFIHGADRVTNVRVRAWLATDDPDVLGALYHAAVHHWSRIEPGISRKQFGTLLERLTAASLARRARTELGLSAHEAVRTFCAFLRQCFDARASEPDAAVCLRAGVRALARLYRHGTSRQRRCIVDAGLEHLFELPGMERCFAAWKKDKTLARAYREAEAWVKSHSTVPD